MLSITSSSTQAARVVCVQVPPLVALTAILGIIACGSPPAQISGIERSTYLFILKYVSPSQFCGFLLMPYICGLSTRSSFPYSALSTTAAIADSVEGGESLFVLTSIPDASPQYSFDSLWGGEKVEEPSAGP